MDNLSLPYFAYGSNLSSAHWTAWCAAQGLPDATLAPLRRAWLPDHTLALNYFSRTHQAGAANVMPAPGRLVPGFLFRADRAAWAALDRKEGHPRTYARAECTVLTEDGREVRAITYAVTPPLRRPFTPPTPAYADRIRAGYRERGLAGELAALEAILAQRPAPAPALFVYGTLLSGQPAEGRLDALGVTARTPATAAGTVWDLGDWPGAIFWPRQSPGVVHGERVTLSAPARAFAALDRFEGFPGWRSPGGLYRRVLVTASGVRAWAYQIQDVTAGRRLTDGDWRR